MKFMKTVVSTIVVGGSIGGSAAAPLQRREWKVGYPPLLRILYIFIGACVWLFKELASNIQLGQSYVLFSPIFSEPDEANIVAFHDDDGDADKRRVRSPFLSVLSFLFSLIFPRSSSE